ncbi:hypothetical protein GW17_00024369 [Ensete ventricosum]|nr:hypothetical protein GW17_00024369 [Ensete ventricosum]RZR79091.1 hypothetical protein BHM03_00004692 [Ensete ventricosum]
MIEGIQRRGRESPGGGGGIDGRHPRKEGRDDGEAGGGGDGGEAGGVADSFLQPRVVLSSLQAISKLNLNDRPSRLSSPFMHRDTALLVTPFHPKDGAKIGISDGEKPVLLGVLSKRGGKVVTCLYWSQGNEGRRKLFTPKRKLREARDKG